MLGIFGGILLILSILTSIAVSTAAYKVPVDKLFNPAIIGWGLFTLIVTGTIMNAISGLILIAFGTLLASGKGRMRFAVSMIVFGILGIVFALAAIGGILGMIGAGLGMIGGSLSKKEIQRQSSEPQERIPPPPPPTPT